MGVFKKIASLSWSSVFSGISSAAVKLMLLSLFIFLILVVVRGFKEEGYSVKPFQVPKKYEDAGYNGQVVAFMIQDEVAAL